LLDLEEEPNEQTNLTTPIKATPKLARKHSRPSALGGTPAGRRARAGSLSLPGEEDDGGVWGGSSDWAIDNRIMFKRRIISVFMVRRFYRFCSYLLDLDN
jgi:phosphate transporter